MKFKYTSTYLKTYKKLPQNIKKKVDKQISNLSIDFFHPSLNTKKKSEYVWEFRVDRRYRMTGSKVYDTLVLLTVGMHDEGLGKK